MQPVRIRNVAVAHPPLRIRQDDAAEQIERASPGASHVRLISRATQIDERALGLTPEEIGALGTIEQRNAAYRPLAADLAARACGGALGDMPPSAVRILATSSCTGYTVPSWSSSMAQRLGFGCDTVRLPITEAGCAGGVVAIARAVDYLRSHPRASGLAAAAEICSTSFHRGDGESTLLSNLIFADGAGAALLEQGAGAGFEVVDSASMLVPDSERLLGFDLRDAGFTPVLDRRLAAALPAPLAAAADRMLAANGLARDDVSAWLLHPGGARVLSRVEQTLGLRREHTRWSWDSMREYGNTSSAAIFDVMRRALADGVRGNVVVAAFGPGVAIELLLLRAT
jgi:alkylresorcinol/alkylpyrone synthase